MKGVYGNSFCNISATKSSYDTSLGLFGQRIVESDTFRPFSVSAEFETGRDRRVEQHELSYSSVFKTTSITPL